MPIPLLIAGLIKAGFSLFGGAIAAKGEDFIKEKLGIDVGELLGTEQGRLQLRQLEMQHQEFLVNAAQTTEARELDYFKAEVEDRGSARTANAAIATNANSGWLQRNLLPLMAMLVTVGFFVCMGSLFYISIASVQLDDNSRNVLIYAFGAMTAGWMVVINYLFGSSHGSRDNQAALAKIAGGKV